MLLQARVLSTGIIATAAVLLKRCTDALADLDVEYQRTSHRLLTCFLILSAGLALLQACTALAIAYVSTAKGARHTRSLFWLALRVQLMVIRLCTRLLWPASTPIRRGQHRYDDDDDEGDESEMLCHGDEVYELLHVDLSRTPPDSEPGMPADGEGGRIGKQAASDVDRHSVLKLT